MALIKKIDPVGIDLLICRLQESLYNGLTWKDAANGYESYHRVYKNESNEGKLPQAFTTNTDYIEVFTNDNFSATSFFLVGDVSTVSEKVKSEISIIFQLNLKETYPAITTHRADEEAHVDVYNILYGRPDVGNITSITKGIRNVYEDLRITQVKYDDMERFHVFKITMDVFHEMLIC